ncbi:MAG TPA: sulfotransferase [Actinomycetota bacterium]|nr:sulfotransferase [Actinomycetota bacterium]
MLPDFFVIGAAKAGTTALYWYLAEHPAIFMSPIKEPNFFAYGLDERGRLLYGDPELHRFPVRTREEYERLFAGAGDAAVVGEASAIYLECPQAAGRIGAAVPGARIVCGLRDPVDRAYSDYLMHLRSRGNRFDPARDLSPDAAWARPDSHWMRIGRYAELLAPYFETFPRDRIHIYLFDDLRRDPLGVVRGVYRFLGVDEGFVPDLATPHNVGGVPSRMLVERLLMNRLARTTIRPFLPRPVVDAARRLRARNLRRPPPLPSAMRARLTEHFREDILATSRLIGRSLDHWLGEESPVPVPP